MLALLTGPNVKALALVAVLAGLTYLAATYGIYKRSDIEQTELELAILQADFETLKRNYDIVNSENDAMRANIASLQQEAQEQQQAILTLEAEKRANLGKVEGLVRMFQEKNFGYLVSERPDTLERLINSGTKTVLDEIRVLTQDAVTPPIRRVPDTTTQEPQQDEN